VSRRQKNTVRSGLRVGTAGVQVSKGEEMLLVGKTAWAGIVFVLLTTGNPGPRPTPLASGVDPRKEAPAVAHPDDGKKRQETLKGKGQYRGAVDGVLGLRTRASLPEFQKTENLPVTGQLDAQTAVKLGVTPEGREEAGYETIQGKPSAGIRRAKGPRRTSKTTEKTAR